MSRSAKFTRSVASGYLLLAANVLFTLAQWPLAMHYLTRREFGLWVVVSSIAVNLQLLIDFGMSGSLGRILIDHKDDRSSNNYGMVIKTGFIALLVQGFLTAVVGSVISLWLPRWMNVPVEFWPVFRGLMVGLCVLSGMAFAARIFSFILQAHQRYDIGNYSQIGGFALHLLALWIGFEMNLGLYSLLLGVTASLVFNNLFSLAAAWRMRLFPAAGRWGQANWKTFREIFAYANDIFLLSVGQVLISLSQAPIITLMLGLEAAAVWGIMTKTFMLAQQLITRVFDFSAAAFAEMMVRDERHKLHTRFRDVVVLTASSATFVCLVFALCNGSFVRLWMHGQFSWGVENDLLMALAVIIATSTRCHVGLAGLTKNIRAMKYIYVIEGAAFVTLCSLLVPRLGLAGVIIAGILPNLFITGIYGLRRSTEYFGISAGEILLGWFKLPARLFALLLAVTLAIWFATHNLAAPIRLAVDSIAIGAGGAFLFWRFGLPPSLRNEVAAALHKVWARLSGA